MNKQLLTVALTWPLTALLAISSLQIAPAGQGAAQAAPTDAATRIPLLVLPIEYSDCRLTIADDDWNKKVFSTPTKEEEDQRFDLFGSNGTSVNNYYKEVTCGRFQFEPAAETCRTAGDGVIRVSVDLKHPLADARGMRVAVGQAMSHAAQYIDFASYDRDNNKLLTPHELTVIVASAGGTEDNTYSRNRCFYGGPNVGGCRCASFVVVSERRDDLRGVYAKLAEAAGVELKYKEFPVSVGTLIHELGHAFGTPDVLSTGYLTAMGYGQKNASKAFFPGTKVEYTRNTPSHYGAYTMVKAGFVEPVVLEETGVYTAYSAATGRYNVYKIPTKDPKEYFLIENRQQEGSDLASGVEGKARRPGGIAIWHVNEAFPPRGEPDKRLLAIEEASEGILGYSYLKKNRRLLALDPFYPLPGSAEFSGHSTPSNRSSSGQPQPWKISEFSASGRVMTFRFTACSVSQ